ncbi:MAG: inositol monophosphatase [Epsilonproteobacteria bacterium]|nr:inositol monophosphatase [Campylobacterota bacterium]
MDFIDFAIKANIEVLAMLQEKRSGIFEEVKIGAGGDVSKAVDIESEKIFIKHLSRFGKIISEECGIYGEAEDEIVIDPIDGSENIASGLPYYGSSVARKRKDRVTDAVIVNFANGDIFVKDKKGFRFANIKKLDFSEIIINNYATIGVYERAYASDRFVCEVNAQNIKYRSPGALALSLAYAHSVRFVVFEGKIREYDVCAGLYMCEDLFMHKEDDFLIVSKDKEIFSKLVKIREGVK